MKVLVTAADGAIGKCFISKYASAHEIIPVEKFDIDFTDIKRVAEILKTVRPEAVVHLDELREDGTALDDVSKVDKTVENYNVVCFKNLQSSCRIYRVRKLIVLGSGREYLSDENGIVNVSEEELAAYRYDGSFVESKRSISRHAKDDGLTVVLRLFDLFGKDIGDGIMADILNRIVSNSPLEFERSRVFSTLFLEDAISIINRALDESFPSGAYNCAYPEPFALNDAVKLAKKACYKLLPVRIKDVEKFDPEYTCNTQKLISQLGDFRFTPPLVAMGRAYKQMMQKQLRD